MKQSQLYLLICAIAIIQSIASQNWISKIFLLIIGIVYGFYSQSASAQEFNSEWREKLRAIHIQRLEDLQRIQESEKEKAKEVIQFIKNKQKKLKKKRKK